MSRRLMTPSDHAQIAALAGEGKTARDIAAVIGCKANAVRAVARSRGVQLANGRHDMFSDHDRCHLMRLADEGCTAGEIASFLHCSPLRVRAKCCALGVRLRREKGGHELRFALTKKTHERLREISKQRGTSPSRFVRLLVEVSVRDGLLEPIADRTVSLHAILLENCRARPVKRVTMDKVSRVPRVPRVPRVA
jgi:DNA-binding CsgD family transcriptional regulator